jgi:hypothetical protein
VSGTIPEDYANELHVLYFPQLGTRELNLFGDYLTLWSIQGYLIRIPSRPEWVTTEDLGQIPGWVFQASG